MFLRAFYLFNIWFFYLCVCMCVCCMCGRVFTLVNAGACVTSLERGVQRSTGVSVLIFQLVFDRVSRLWLCTPSETLMSGWEFSGSTPNLLAPPPVSLQECWGTGGTATACFMLYRGSGNPLHTGPYPCTECAFPTEPSPLFRCLSAVTEVDGYNRKLGFRRGRVWETLASRLLRW